MSNSEQLPQYVRLPRAIANLEPCLPCVNDEERANFVKLVKSTLRKSGYRAFVRFMEDYSVGECVLSPLSQHLLPLNAKLSLDAPGFIESAVHLLRGHPDMIIRFNTFIIGHDIKATVGVSPRIAAAPPGRAKRTKNKAHTAWSYTVPHVQEITEPVWFFRLDAEGGPILVQPEDIEEPSTRTDLPPPFTHRTLNNIHTARTRNRNRN